MCRWRSLSGDYGRHGVITQRDGPDAGRGGDQLVGAVAAPAGTFNQRPRLEPKAAQSRLVVLGTRAAPPSCGTCAASPFRTAAMCTSVAGAFYFMNSKQGAAAAECISRSPPAARSTAAMREALRMSGGSVLISRLDWR